MHKRGTVLVTLSREEAMYSANWLKEDYRPGPPPSLSPDDWADKQISAARRLAKILDKAARRKRRGSSLCLQIPRSLARWFGTFTEPEGNWFFPTGRDRAKDVCLSAQSAPESIRPIASLFMRAASRRRGRPAPSLRVLEQEEERALIKMNTGPDSSDDRWVRRVRARLNYWRWAKGEPKN